MRRQIFVLCFMLCGFPIARSEEPILSFRPAAEQPEQVQPRAELPIVFVRPNAGVARLVFQRTAAAEPVQAYPLPQMPGAAQARELPDGGPMAPPEQIDVLPTPIPPAMPEAMPSPGATLSAPVFESGSIDELTPRAPEMVGGLAPLGVAFGPFGGTVVVPSARAFKVADNSSARPQDRVFASVNFFSNLYDGGADLTRYTFGCEKAFWNGRMSVSMRLPVSSVYARNLDGPRTTRTDSEVSDLGFVFRAALYADPVLDNYFTVGVGVSTPNGPRTLVEADTLDDLHDVDVPRAATVQPFFGMLYHAGVFYFQGFTAFDISTSPQLPSLMFTDYGVGCFIYTNQQPDVFLTALSQTTEIHITTPLDSSGDINFAGPFTAVDIFNFTFATNFEFWQRVRMAIGVATPVTGPSPFDVQVIVQLRAGF